MRVFNSAYELEAARGEHLGYSEWHTITQAQIDMFAAATGDHQWIHTDQERSARGPFGTTIAHGYLTLSMVATFSAEIFRIDGADMIVNYGLGSVRFPSPVPVNERVRAGAELLDVTRTGNGLRVAMRFTAETGKGTKPALVADAVLLVLEATRSGGQA